MSPHDARFTARWVVGGGAEEEEEEEEEDNKVKLEIDGAGGRAGVRGRDGGQNAEDRSGYVSRRRPGGTRETRCQNIPQPDTAESGFHLGSHTRAATVVRPPKVPLSLPAVSQKVT